jgi:hypothetical protein
MQTLKIDSGTAWGAWGAVRPCGAGRHGVSVRLIKPEVRPHREARATAIQPGTLEILESVGPLQPFLNASERVRYFPPVWPRNVPAGRHEVQ